MTEEQTAVIEAPPRPTLKVLQALVEMKKAEVKHHEEALADLWHQRRKATLPLARYPEVMLHEDGLRVACEELDRLQPQLESARAVDTMTKAKDHHDAYCAPIAEQGQRVCQVWQTLLQEGAKLMVLIDEQISPLVVLTKKQCAADV